MPLSAPAQRLGKTPEYGDTEPTAAIVTNDNLLVAHLQDRGLRRLCTSASGLSRPALQRLEAVAEALRNTE
ncbi:hypothetical protein [Nocardia salmonicida]|uniref:hypothetical protein n=1 Tax=Nocardia salmonicida TaxID=53431 RepID=UPI0033D3C7D9